MHAGGDPACGCRSTREDLSSLVAYWREPVGLLSVPCSQGNGLGAYAWYCWGQVHGVVRVEYHLEFLRVVMV